MALKEQSTNKEPAVFGENTDGGVGVFGLSQDFRGVEGHSTKEHGVFGESTSGAGVAGESTNFVGVFGHSIDNTGVFGSSNKFEGVHGESNSPTAAGVSGINESTGIGVFGKGGRVAGRFEGDVEVTGNITAHDVVLSAADCAEDFNISGIGKVEPGTVMVIDREGALQQSQQAYDKKVAGVISGAGGYTPAITLDKQPLQNNRMPVALVGKVYCRVDAQYSPIEVGDLLTTSPTPGHAMKAGDPLKSFGAVIGKALRPLEAGQRLIPILIALQ